MPKEPERSLEEAIFAHIQAFPERIDEMETRSDAACRQLAREIAELVEAYYARTAR